MELHYTPNLNPRVAVAAARHLNAPVTYIRANPRTRIRLRRSAP